MTPRSHTDHSMMWVEYETKISSPCTSLPSLLVACSIETGKAACSEIEEAVGKSGVCVPVKFDQSNPDSIDSLVDMVKNEYDQKITALVKRHSQGK